MVENGVAKDFVVICFSSDRSFSLLKYKCDLLFSVFLSLDQNVMKPEKRAHI